MCQLSKKLITYKQYCCFYLSDFPTHSMFTFDVCRGSLGTSIFGNSSSAASNTWFRLPSRLSFRFLWLCLYATAHKTWCFEKFTLELDASSCSFKITFILLRQVIYFKKMVVSLAKFTILIPWSHICIPLILL